MSVSVGFVSNASGLAVSSSIGILSPSGPGNGADGPKSGKTVERYRSAYSERRKRALVESRVRRSAELKSSVKCEARSC